MIKALLNFFTPLFVWWNRQTVSTKIYTYFSGTLIGEDSLGNKYYTTSDKCRRWVVYQKDNYASEVAIEWHGWLHWTTNSIPIKSNSKSPEKGRVYSENNLGRKGRSSNSSEHHSDYQAWDPDS